MGKIFVEVGLANNQDVQLWKARMIPEEQVRKIRVQASIDTGANYLVLPTTVADFLGLPRAGEATVRYADGRSGKCEMVEQVEVELLGRKSTFRALLEPNRTTALISAIVLEDLDIVVDCGMQRIELRDPNRIVTEVE